MIEKTMRKRVKMLIVSDVHLGLGICKAEVVAAILNYFEYDLLVLLGDIFDSSNLKRLKDKHFEVLHRINRKAKHGCQVEWIPGNHDEAVISVLKLLIGAESIEEFVWTYRGKTYCFRHGHMEDRFLFDHPVQSAIAAGIYWVVNYLPDRFAEPICGFLKHWAKGYARAQEQVARRALKHAEENRYDYIFCGHVHHTMHMEDKGRHYYNTGCATELPVTCMTITDEGIIRHHYFDGAGQEAKVDIPPQ